MRAKSQLSAVGSIAACAALGLLATPDDRASAQVNDRPPPGVGVLCSWAIYAAIATVGEKCHPGEDAEFRSMLSEIIARFDAYVLANSTPPVTSAGITDFKRQQGQTYAPATAICANNDAEAMYQVTLKAGANELRKSADELLARPGNPQWGTCL